MNLELFKKIEQKNIKYSSIFNDKSNIFLVSKLTNTIDKFNPNLELVQRFEFRYDYNDICFSSTNKLFYGLKIDENSKNTMIEIIDTDLKIVSNTKLNLNTTPTEIDFDDINNELCLKVTDKVLKLNVKTFKLVKTMPLSEFKKNISFYNIETFDNWLKTNAINFPTTQHSSGYILLDVTNINTSVYVLERLTNGHEVVTKISHYLFGENKTNVSEQILNAPNTATHDVSEITNESSEKSPLILLSKDDADKRDSHENNQNYYYDYSDFSDTSLDDLNYDYLNFENFSHENELDGFEKNLDYDFCDDLSDKSNDIFVDNDFGYYGFDNAFNNSDKHYDCHEDNNHGCHEDDKHHNDDCEDKHNNHHKDECGDKHHKHHSHHKDKCDDKHHSNHKDKCEDEHHENENRGDCHKHNCDKAKDNCNEIMHSIANVELAIAHILHSEGAKIQKVVKCSDSVCEILEVNNSVIEVIEKVTRLEDTLCCKLKALKDVCPKNHDCHKKHCLDKFD